MKLLTHDRAALGSGLLAIDRRRARDYERVMAAAGCGPPAGWNRAGEHGAPAGWDLVLVAPRTLSVLLYELIGQALAQLEHGPSGVAHANVLFDHHQQLAGAHHQAVTLVVRQFARAGTPGLAMAELSPAGLRPPGAAAHPHHLRRAHPGRPAAAPRPPAAGRPRRSGHPRLPPPPAGAGRRRGGRLRLVGAGRPGRQRGAGRAARRAAGCARPSVPAAFRDRRVRLRGRGPVGMPGGVEIG
jgi:hypothetical protein